MSASGNRLPLDVVSGEHGAASVEVEERGAQGLAAAQWYAVYTRSRHEKVAHRALAEKGVESFLPLYDILSSWKDRRKWVQKPVFPGYLFARVLRNRVGLVRGARGVVRLVSDGGGPVPVPAKEVEAVRQMMESPLPVDRWPYLRSGKRVRVKAGSLKGAEGYIVTRRKQCRLVISVHLLGRSVATEVGIDCIEPI